MRIRLAAPGDGDEVDAVLAELGERGPVSVLQRALANSPDAARVYVAMSHHVRNGSGLENDLREIVILRVQAHLGGEYEWRRHVPAAGLAGVSSEQISQLTSWRGSHCFSPRHRAGLALTEAYLQRVGVADAMTEVRQHFTEAETVELCLLIGFYLLGGALILPFDLADGDSHGPAPIPLPSTETETVRS